MILDKEQLNNILISELGYTSEEADAFLRDFPPLHDELADAVGRWLQDRTIADTSIFGITLSDFMRLRRAHFLMAVRELNRLYDANLTAERRERLVEILRKPIIRW